VKISYKSVQSFSRNLANKLTKKDKESDQKQYPVPRCIGDGVGTDCLDYHCSGLPFCIFHINLNIDSSKFSGNFLYVMVEVHATGLLVSEMSLLLPNQLFVLLE